MFKVYNDTTHPPEQQYVGYKRGQENFEITTEFKATVPLWVVPLT